MFCVIQEDKHGVTQMMKNICVKIELVMHHGTHVSLLAQMYAVTKV